MKVSLLKQKLHVGYLHSGLLALAVNIFLASTSLAQLADTSIVFMSTHSGVAKIYRMSSDGKQIRQLTEEPQHADEPAWSPDLDGNWEIYIMNADGANPI